MKLSCVFANNDRAYEAMETFIDYIDFVEVSNSDVIVVIGGDGFMLESIHKYGHLGKPFYGINRGTVGFLMNEYLPNKLGNRINDSRKFEINPLKLTMLPDGEKDFSYAWAYNEVTFSRAALQSANIEILINKIKYLEKFVGDGLIVSTPMGSTAYNFSAHGPILPIGSKIVALTPISPFRPRRWRGALLPEDSMIELANMDTTKRPLVATADFEEFRNLERIWVNLDKERFVTLLFDRDRTLDDLIIKEQFAI